jgi:hypothetical protein
MVLSAKYALVLLPQNNFLLFGRKRAFKAIPRGNLAGRAGRVVVTHTSLSPRLLGLDPISSPVGWWMGMGMAMGMGGGGVGWRGREPAPEIPLDSERIAVDARGNKARRERRRGYESRRCSSLAGHCGVERE